MSLNEFNGFLESFYNSPHLTSPKGRGIEGKIFIEKISYIKHYFYYNDVKNKKEPEVISGSLKELNDVKDHDLSKIDDEIKNKIIEKVAKIKELNKKNISENSKLIVDLFFDSLDLAEIKSFVQANFLEASNSPIGDLKTIGDLIIMAVGKSENVEELKFCKWKEFGRKGDLVEVLDGKIKTISYLWKQNFKKNKKEDFVYDNIFGLQTKKDFILKSYFISQKLKQINGENLGIMLPAVSGASLLILSSYLDGKIPVMFNWTLPEEAFKHCVNFSKVEKIISVSSFFDRVETEVLTEYKRQDKFIFLEDLLKNGKISEKISAFIKSIFLPLPKTGQTHRSAPTENVGVNLSVHPENNIAVILFTSGSESLPKAVTLTYKNLIENITGRLKRFIKIAGEMISLPAVEETLAKKYNTGDELEVAIEALEKDGEAKIVLFRKNRFRGS